MTTRIPAALLARKSDQTIVAGWRDPAMQRISDALRSGLTWYVHGSLPLPEASRLVAKFQERFPPLLRDRRHAHRRKLASEPRYKLIVFANRSSDEALFWLMTDRPEDPRESWRDATGLDRLRCYDYEAIRLTRQGAATPAWSWAMTADRFDRLKTEIKDAIRRGAPAIAIGLGEEARTWAGFAGVREQHAALRKIYLHEWARKFRSQSEPPPWPRLRYVQRLRTR